MQSGIKIKQTYRDLNNQTLLKPRCRRTSLNKLEVLGHCGTRGKAIQ